MSVPVPAIASTAVRALLHGPVQPLAVLARFPAALYLAAPASGAVALTVVARDGVHHPNALVLVTEAAARPFASLDPGRGVEVGAGTLRLGRDEVRPTRWWDPRPALPSTTPAVLADRAARLAALVRASAPALPGDLAGPLADLTAALGHLDAAAAVRAARRLVGRGPGLTPSGDDLLAGLLAGVPLLAASTGAAGTDPLTATLRVVGDDVVRRAPDATTAVSAALLVHAARGEVARPAAGVLASLAGGAGMHQAASQLLAVGATSGRDLALGLLAAADLVTNRDAARAAGAVPGHPTGRITR